MHTPRGRALLAECNALQAQRARAFLGLVCLAETTDPAAFCDALADVAGLHARASLDPQRRAEWELLAAAAHRCYLDLLGR